MADGGNVTLGNGTSGNETCDYHQELIKETWVRSLLIVAYVVIFAIGVVGNVLVIAVVARNRSMHSPTNIFIVNMALSDVLMCLFAVPFTPLHAFLDQWIFGDVLCKLFPTSQVRDHLGLYYYLCGYYSCTVSMHTWAVITETV